MQVLDATRKPRCATSYITPNSLDQHQLDRYLANGWYRVGQGLVWCETIALERGIRGVVWTRVPMEGFKFKKSSRRIRRKVEDEFDVTVGPSVLDMEHELLYQQYLTVVTGERNSSMKELRYGQRQIDLFDTWEVTIRRKDNGALVAFSWFDLGYTSVESLIGVYDPKYAKFSLGIYTMLREVQFCIDTGRTHFYAGYVLCGDPAMDYKLSTGGIEVLDRDQEVWRCGEAFDYDLANPLNKAQMALEEIASQTGDRRVIFHENRHFALSAYASALDACLAYPLVLLCPHVSKDALLVVGWDTIAAHYEVLLCDRAALTSSLTQEIISHDLLVIRESLGTWSSAKEAMHILNQYT